jgi:hypothetical protein
VLEDLFVSCERLDRLGLSDTIVLLNGMVLRLGRVR